jgi:photoactive yellow protein
VTTTLRDRIMNTRPAAAPASPGSFVPTELFSSLGSLNRGDADSFDFGIVKCDDSGKVLLINRYECEMGGVSPTTTEGKNFFTQVAPCSNNTLFFGSFRKGVAAANLNVTFPYTFNYKMKPTNVRVHLFRCNSTRTNWVFVQKV